MQRAKALSDQLVALHSPVSNNDLVSYITEGLGGSDRPFVRALEARLDTVSYEDLYGLLLSEEMQLQRDEQPSDPLNVSANYTKRINRGGHTNRARGHGHSLTFPNRSSQYSSINFDVVCHTCRG